MNCSVMLGSSPQLQYLKATPFFFCFLAAGGVIDARTAAILKLSKRNDDMVSVGIIGKGRWLC